MCQMRKLAWSNLDNASVGHSNADKNRTHHYYFTWSHEYFNGTYTHKIQNANRVNITESSFFEGDVLRKVSPSDVSSNLTFKKTKLLQLCVTYILRLGSLLYYLSIRGNGCEIMSSAAICNFSRLLFSRSSYDSATIVMVVFDLSL